VYSSEVVGKVEHSLSAVQVCNLSLRRDDDVDGFVTKAAVCVSVLAVVVFLLIAKDLQS
jgi:hypothetical protein